MVSRGDVAFVVPGPLSTTHIIPDPLLPAIAVVSAAPITAAVAVTLVVSTVAVLTGEAQPLA